MKTILLFTSICLVVMINTTSAQTVDPADANTSITEKAMDLYNAHKYKESIPEFTKAIKENPKDGKAYYYRGMAKMHEKQDGFCKDMEESLKLGYANSSDLYYYGCNTHAK